MTKPVHLRTTLSATTVLAAGLMLAAAPANAQIMPDPGTVTSVTSGLSGGAPGSTNPTFTMSGSPGAPGVPSTQTLQIDLKDNRTILNWGGSGFSISAGNTVDFKDARATSGVTGRTDNIAVLNRTTGWARMNIDGTLRSDANVAVYLVSQGGVMFGATAAVDTGSLFAAAGNITNDNDFLNASSTLRFSDSGGADIGASAGARFTTRASSSSNGGRMGDFALIGSRVIFNASAVAKATANVGGDAALIVAKDVSVVSQPGSPLSFVVHAGSTFTDARVWVGGDITARNITIIQTRAGSATNPFPTLGADIEIDGSLAATGVLQTDRGIVLTAGTAATGVAMGVAPGTGPTAAILSGGTIKQTTNGVLTSAKNFSAAATSFEVNNPITATGHAEFRTRLTASITPPPNPGRTSITAGSIAFHSTTNLRGKVTATSGDITATATGSSLTFGAGVEAAGNLTATADSVSITGGTTVGGALSVNGVSNVSLLDGTRAASIDVGTTGAYGTVRFTGNTVSTTGGISARSTYTLNMNDVTSAGAVVLRGDYTLATGVIVGTEVNLAGGSSPLDNWMTSAISASGVTATAGNIVARGRDISIGGVIAASGDITLQALGTAGGPSSVMLGTAMARASVTAGGDIAISAGGTSGMINAFGNMTAGGGLSLTAPGAIGLIGSSSAPTVIKAAGSITLTSTASNVGGSGLLTVQSNSDGIGSEALTISGTRAASFATTTSLFGGTARQSDIQIRFSEASPLSLGRVEARGLLGSNGAAVPFANGITLSGANAITLGGPVILTNDLLLNASEISMGAGTPITVTNGGVDFTSSFPVISNTISASRDIVIRGHGTLTLGSTAVLTAPDIVLSTATAFINNGGSLNASGHWVIYSANPANNTFGGLNSNSTAIWGARLVTRAPSTISGNRYVFSIRPTLTFSTVDFSKIYGIDLTGSASIPFAVSGYHPGVAGAFLGDTAATAFAGNPLIQSAGFAERASVAGGPYAQTIARGSLQSASGYGFAFAPSTGLVAVTPKSITGSIAADNKIYDGSIIGTGTVSLNGVVAGDTVGTSGSVFAFLDKNAGTGKTVNVTGTTLTGADSGNYTLTVPASALADILQKALTITVNANGKTYDGNTATTGTVSLNGVVTGDTVNTTGSTFTFADKNAGTGKTVNVTGTTLTGADSGNYTLTLPANAIADILQKALTATVTANNKTYDGSTAATGALTLNGVVAGDTVGTAGSTFTFADKNAGTGKTVAISGTTLTGADSGNYTLTVPGSALADILKKALTATVTADGKTYDGTTATTGTVALNGVVAGDAVGTSGTGFAFADKNAGTGKVVNITGTALTGTDSGNYTLTVPATALADILKKALTATVTANSKTYDGTTAATGSVALDGVVGGDTVSTGGITFTFADRNAGTGKTVAVGGGLSGADAGNYTVSLPATVLADILKKALTATVSANGKTYDGTTAATGSVALNGVVSGDTVSTGGITFTFADRNAGTGKTVAVGGGLSGADAGNYTVSLPATVLADILKKALTATVTANGKTYDGTTAATGSVALNGVVSGDSVGTSGTAFAFADKNAGSGKTVNVTGTTLNGADSGNYTLTIPATALADIAKRGLSVIAGNQEKYTGDADPALTYSITLGSLLSGDQLTGALARAAGEAPGDYAIGQGSLSAGGNYSITFTPGTLTITVNPATNQPQTLRAVPLPSGIQPPPAAGSGISIDASALCAEDTSCVAN